MAAMIIIKRKVPKQKEKNLLLAVAQPGYISGQTLKSVDDPEELLVISTWQSVDNWKAWLSSKQRGEIQDKIDKMLGEKTEYGVYFQG